MPKGRSSQDKPLGHAIQELIQSLGIGRKLRSYDAVTRWDEIVGERIAKVTTATRIDNGVLTVKVNNAPWRSELLLMKEEIIRKINATLGETLVTDIRFV